MAGSAVTNIASIGGGMIMNIVKAIGTVVFAAGLFYGIRWIQKGTKKQKAFKIQTPIVDMNGTIEFDKMGFVKNDKTSLLEMQFQKRKQDSVPPIPKHLIKNGYAPLLNYAPGHYAVIDTYKTIKHIEEGGEGFILHNLGMKKYLISKQREILNNAEDKKKKWELYAPWITLGIGIIAVVILTAFLFYFGVKLDAANIAARTAECAAVGWK